MTAKQSANRRAYNKELARLRRQERRMMERGYIFEDPTGEYIGFVPQSRPQRITAASVKKLQKIGREQYYKKGSFIDPNTGEVFTAAEGKVLERKLKKKTTVNLGFPGPEEPVEEWAPTVDDIVALIKKESRLKKYGGWINDDGRRQYFTKKVDTAIDNTRAWWSGKEDNIEMRVIVGRELQKYFDSTYVYEDVAFSIKADTMKSFETNEESFDKFIDALEKAQTKAFRLTLGA